MHEASIARAVIGRRTMHDGTVVPDDDVVLAPFVAMAVSGLCRYREQFVQQLAAISVSS